MSASCLLQHALDSGLYPGPSGKTLGVSLESFDSAAGTARAVFTPREHFCNPFGTIQGGFVAAMLDETLGLALATKLTAHETAPTLELKTSFINPALPGTIRAAGRVVS
ncbi:MAG: PaaI family thioesterase, partial [Deltaproteobacteria bacterium]|nr:PaaI family thioesterase [Deltaproteobacteria bacterium]